MKKLFNILMVLAVMACGVFSFFYLNGALDSMPHTYNDSGQKPTSVQKNTITSKTVTTIITTATITTTKPVTTPVTTPVTSVTIPVTTTIITTTKPVATTPKVTTTKKPETKPADPVAPTGDKVVYLTFDDGPSEITPRVLEVLDRYNVKATFFVTGSNPKYNNYIKIANDKGHTIGMHTYSHKYEEVYKSDDAYFNDLNKIANLCKEQIGFVPKYIRFPGGSSNKVSAKHNKGIMTRLVAKVEQQGYKYFDWNCATADSAGAKTLEQQLDNAKKGDKLNCVVILAHDAKGKGVTPEVLPKIIEYYQSKGYVFKAIDDSTPVCHHRVHN
ncbi:MAG: polysaccharide deacetylase [Clostridiales bacterium]|nr:polysaccharide deacetylase [Clostridiales bacterium]